MRKFQKIAAIVLMTAMVFAAGCNPEENKDSDIKVTTSTPQDITSTTAVCGGDVIVPQGLTLNELGVCWSTDSMPTVEDSHLSTSNWSEPYTCIITGLEPYTRYHVRAYALCGLEYYYGDDKSFNTDHDYVDLGLPSGTLWATCNVGVDTRYGDYFAWGETHTKDCYDWSTYRYCMGSNNTLTKYCRDSRYGYNGFTDDLTILEPSDDAATANWGSGWCMPTADQWRELHQNTTNTWTNQNGVYGSLFTASNGNSLFLPAPAYQWDPIFYHGRYYGEYWSSSLDTDHAVNFYIDSDSRIIMSHEYRCVGNSVRAVRSSRQN